MYIMLLTRFGSRAISDMCRTETVLLSSDKGDSSVEEVSMRGGRAATAVVSRTSEKKVEFVLGIAIGAVARHKPRVMGYRPITKYEHEN